MGGLRAVENDVACLLWIGPFASGLANQDRPSSSAAWLLTSSQGWTGGDRGSQLRSITLRRRRRRRRETPWRTVTTVATSTSSCCIHRARTPPGSSSPLFFELQILVETSHYPFVCTHKFVFKIYVDSTRGVFTAVHVTCPKKGAFSLAALASVHSVSVRFRLSIEAAVLTCPRHRFSRTKIESSRSAFAPQFEPNEGASDIRCNEADVDILRSCRAHDRYQFAVTIDECASATLMATHALCGARSSSFFFVFLDIKALFNPAP
jgi:hypothetical protein